MISKSKNIILFGAIMISLILIYFFLIKKDPEEKNSLVSSATVSSADDSAGKPSATDDGASITRDFLSILLNVKSLKLDDSIFSDRAFINLRDSSILLLPTGDEGRPNPFAPINYNEIMSPKSSESGGSRI